MRLCRSNLQYAKPHCLQHGSEMIWIWGWNCKGSNQHTLYRHLRWARVTRIRIEMISQCAFKKPLSEPLWLLRISSLYWNSGCKSEVRAPPSSGPLHCTSNLSAANTAAGMNALFLLHRILRLRSKFVQINFHSQTTVKQSAINMMESAHTMYLSYSIIIILMSF